MGHPALQMIRPAPKTNNISESVASINGFCPARTTVAQVSVALAAGLRLNQANGSLLCAAVTVELHPLHAT